MRQFFFLFSLIFTASFFIATDVFAHPGTTDSKGGHRCEANCTSWGLYDGEYHYHNANGTSIFTYDNNAEFYDLNLTMRLKGRIALQVEQHGEAWFIRNSDRMRYYMPDGDAAYEMMRYFSLGISDADLAKIPKVNNTTEMNQSKTACASNALANRLKGEILLQVQQHGEAWYLDPVKCRAIYLKDGAAAYDTMRYLGLGITDTDLYKIVIGMSDTILEQLMDDTVTLDDSSDSEPTLPPVDYSRDHVWGSANAKVTMIEYSDFECPYCARHRDTMDAIKELYPNDVRIVFRHFPLSFHPSAQKAAEASECAADQGKFWEMYHKIFDLNEQGNMSINAFKQAATEIGLARGQFDPCLDSGIKAARVAEDVASGEQAGVQGAPATFIDSYLVSGAVPLDEFISLIELDLASK